MLRSSGLSCAIWNNKTAEALLEFLSVNLTTDSLEFLAHLIDRSFLLVKITGRLPLWVLNLLFVACVDRQIWNRYKFFAIMSPENSYLLI